ncbi:MAG: LytTR family DNA-binding domain-containing protein [Bacteroidales bacterium]|nr:LytTR family DNA-binding domain-containing protein [Bacteroidales bacterium]
MIRALAMDDEPLALRLLEVFAAKIPDLEIVAGCIDTGQARPFLDKVDVVFADINMPLQSGMDFVASLERPPLVVFTTAFADYAVDAFRVGAVDYLLKPFTFDEFSRAVSRVRKALEMRASKGPKQEKLAYFKSDYKIVPVKVSDVRYVESFGPYMKIYLASSESPLVVLSSFKQILQELPSDRFIRIHKSYVADMTRITAAGKSSVTLDDGQTLPVGDTYRAAFMELYMNEPIR